jgi:hypothetical protein
MGLVDMSEPSSQGPCICPEDGVLRDCPRCGFMVDYVGQNPFKDHLREHYADEGHATSNVPHEWQGLPDYLLDEMDGRSAC